MSFENNVGHDSRSLFLSPPDLPPSRNALVNMGMVDVVHRVRGGPRAASRGRWPPLAGGVHPSRPSTGRLPLTVRTADPAEFRFFQDLSPALPHLIALQLSDETERALILQKQDQLHFIGSKFC